MCIQGSSVNSGLKKMTKKELIEILNNSFVKDDDEVVIEIYKHGSIGSTPSVDVKKKKY